MGEFFSVKNRNKPQWAMKNRGVRVLKRNPANDEPAPSGELRRAALRFW
jgi:hypothetical protein